MFNAFRSLSAAQQKIWKDQGYLHLKKAISPTEMAAVRKAVDWQWANPMGNPHQVDVITGPHAGRCFSMNEAPPSVRSEAYKLNNLFLYSEQIRNVALSRTLKPVLAELLNGEPMICNSLNFERGSQQDAHIDSWYMPPPKDEGMVAASITLDPVDDQNGPIFFYPGSHQIPPYRFSDGRLNAIEAEMAACHDYIRGEIEKRNLEVTLYKGQPGDVLIWHGQLIHGGSPIKDFARTRNSLVVHYWRAEDVSQSALFRGKGGSAYLGHTLRGELTPLSIK